MHSLKSTISVSYITHNNALRGTKLVDGQMIFAKVTLALMHQLQHLHRIETDLKLVCGSRRSEQCKHVCEKKNIDNKDFSVWHEPKELDTS